MEEYKGPRPEVQLVGHDGNAYAIMGRVAKALKRAGCSKEHVESYYEESKRGDYNHLLRVACEYAVVE